MMPDLGEDLDDIGFDLAFPELLWVVRDFQLNLEINGTRITDDEYLQNALSTSNMGRHDVHMRDVKNLRLLSRKQFTWKSPLFAWSIVFRVCDLSWPTMFPIASCL